MSQPLKLFLLLLLLTPVGTYAHHGHTRTFGPGGAGRSQKPSDAVNIGQEYRKGDRENRHTAVTTIGVEKTFKLRAGRLSLNANLPYYYFRQQNRRDAARYGRLRTGLRFMPNLQFLKPFYLVGDVDVGFPTGSNRNRFLDENYRDSGVGLTLGLEKGLFFAAFRAGGVFPLNRLPRASRFEDFRLPWQPEIPMISRSTHDLKKSGDFSLEAGLKFHKRFRAYLSGRYRTPYEGGLKEKETGDDTPRFYREVGAGAALAITKKIELLLEYRYPLHRRRKYSNTERLAYILTSQMPPDPKAFRLYDESFYMQVRYSF